jgi:NAD(P)-dependent dehydrogenase (short-subunit alcohol dehydrogenase family)
VVSGVGRLEGRACLIVGGTSGIGLATARRFLAEGGRVAITGRTAEEVESASAALGSTDGTFGEVLDLEDAEAVEPTVWGLAECLGGRLDVLVHVAGLSGRRSGDGSLDECTVEGWEHVLRVNARGVFLTNRSAVRRMRRQPLDESGLRGSVVNVGSVLSSFPSPRRFGTIAYAASKGAVESLTIACAAAYAGERIRFNLIAPGLIDTPIAARAVNDPEIRRYLESKQPLGGPGRAADCAEAALALAEPASRFLTGQVLRVDGGWGVSEGPP